MREGQRVVVYLTGSHHPRRSRTRRLRLTDLSIFMAVMALACLATRPVAARLLPAAGPARAADYAGCAAPLGMAAAGLLAIYRLRGRRGRLGSPLRDPGAVAGMMLVLTAWFSLLTHLYGHLLYDLHIESCPLVRSRGRCTHLAWLPPDPHYLGGPSSGTWRAAPG